MYLSAQGSQGAPFLCPRGRISLPLTGAWVADVSIDPQSSNAPQPAVGSPLTLVVGDGGFTLQGAILRANNAFGTLFARVVGGAGGLWRTVAAKAYQNATFGLILADLLGQVGEVISPTTPSSILDNTLPFWTVTADTAAKALANLLLGARSITGTPVNWRVLVDGTIQLGVEQWPAATMAGFDLLSWSPQQLAAKFFASNPSLIPGQAWQGGNVSNVDIVVEPDRIRSRVWWLP